MKRIFFCFLFLIFILYGCAFKPEKVIFEDAEFVYDGEEKSILCLSEIPSGYTLSYENNTATDAGVYTAKLYIYEEESGELLEQKEAKLTILKAEYDMSGVTFKDSEAVYNGKEHSLSLKGQLPDGVSVTLSKNAFVDAGRYTVTASFSGDTKNYEAISDMTAVLTVLPSDATPSFTLKNNVLHSASLPEFETDIEGETVFGTGQALTPGKNVYLFDFYPKSSNYKTKLNLSIELDVKATVRYVSNGKETVKYIDCGKKAESISGTSYEKDDILYVFSHWSLEENGEPFNFDTFIYNDITLHGVFKTEEKEYVLLYRTQTDAVSFGYYPSALPSALPILSDAGFLGWYKNRFYSSEKFMVLYNDDIEELYALYAPRVELNENEWLEAREYEKKIIDVKKEDIFKGALCEVNEVIPSKANEKELISLYGNISSAKLANSALKADKEAIDALQKLSAAFDAKKSGTSILVSGAYEENASLPDLESGYSFLLKCSASTDKIYELEDNNARTLKEFLSFHAQEYGFIERYPEENQYYTNVSGEKGTGIYRYVGVPHATFMENHSLSLEEYLCYIKSLGEKHLFIKDGNIEYEIFYQPYYEPFSIPKEDDVTISGNNSDGFIITVKRNIAPRKLDFLLCLDAGHGGTDPGAGSSAPYEANVNLSVVKLLKEECERQGFSVLLTRDTDVFVELDGRCQIANNANASIFVSIHCNSASTASASGTEVYYCYGSKSTLLANKVYSRMIDAVPLTSRGVKTENHYVTKNTNMPAILCELAFISNSSDRSKLISPEYQAKWAEAICRGICDYYGVSYLEFD